MMKKDLKKLPIMDMIEELITSGETLNLIEAIRQERGTDKIIKNIEEELEKRKTVLGKLSKKGQRIK